MHRTDVNTEDSKKQTGKKLDPLFVGSYKTYNGGHVSVERGEAINYADMRAAQLKALLTIIYGEGGDAFRLYNEHIQDNVLWLAGTLAQELIDLLPLVASDAASLKGGA